MPAARVLCIYLISLKPDNLIGWIFIRRAHIWRLVALNHASVDRPERKSRPPSEVCFTSLNVNVDRLGWLASGGSK